MLVHLIVSLSLVATLVGAGSAAAAEQTIRGKTLTIVNPGDATKRKAIGTANESHSSNTLVGNPTATGAVLELIATGGSLSQQLFTLPQVFWSASSKGYAYKDAHGANGPVQSVKIQRNASGTFLVKAKIAGAHGTLNVVPPNPGSAGCLALSINGGDRYSVAFGPDATFTNAGTKRFVASKPSAESVCSTVPTTTTTTTSSTTTTTLAGTCPAANFLNVAAGPGAGSGYPAPSLTVTCTATQVTVQSNGIPHYTFVAVTPNGLSAGTYVYNFPRYPVVAASPTTLPLLGNTGVTVGGMTLTGPNEAAFPDPYGDPVANAITDNCYGHTAPGGSYHNHALRQKCLIPSGLVAQPWNNPDPSTSARSPILAYGLDGFPVYGPYECTDATCTTVYEALSSFDNVGYQSVDCTSSAQCNTNYACALSMINGVQRKACVPKTYAWTNNQYSAKVGTQYMDQCNGHYGPGGDYHYHATATFPYAMGCYRGSTL